MFVLFPVIFNVKCYFLRPASLHSAHDRVVAVMGMDLTMGFIHKLLSEVIPICAHQNIRSDFLNQIIFHLVSKNFHIIFSGIIHSDDYIDLTPFTDKIITYAELFFFSGVLLWMTKVIL